MSDLLQRPPALSELQRARLVRAMVSEDGQFDAGTEGTIVFVWREGEAYELEVTRPREGLLTVTAEDIEPI